MREASKVLVKLIRPLGVMAAASMLCMSAWGQAAQAPAAQKNWKDRAEYDLYESITKTQEPAKRLELLNQWKEKYPATDFKQERLLLYLNTYQGLNQAAPMYSAAKDIVANDPKDMTGLYWLNMLAPVQPGAATNADVLDTAEKAGKGILENLDTAFAADKKPAQATAEQWTKAKNDMGALGDKTLGWVAMTRKNNEEAEKDLRASLALNPNAGEVDYWLGSVLYAQKKVPEALFYFARASQYDGPGALDAATRTKVNDYLGKAYKGYHGDDKGLDQLKALAKANPAPPADFKIESVTEIAEQQSKADEEAKKSDPQGALWKTIKEALTGDQGPAYFDGSMKGTKPPEKAFRGKVVTATAKEITLAMSPGVDAAEATLRFETPVPKVEAGTEMYFTGIPASYTKEPFMVVFDAERADVTGFPAAAPKPKPAKRK